MLDIDGIRENWSAESLGTSSPIEINIEFKLVINYIHIESVSQSFMIDALIKMRQMKWGRCKLLSYDTSQPRRHWTFPLKMQLILLTFSFRCNVKHSNMNVSIDSAILMLGKINLALHT